MNSQQKSTKYRFFGGTDLDGKRLTWSGVIAGILTFIAIFLTLSLIGFSIGLTTFNPIAENPLYHVGTNVTIWTLIALVISFAAGGFVSGLVANKAGFLHGFMTWVTGIVLLAFLVTNTIGGILKTTGNVVTNVTTGVAKGSSIIVSKSGNLLGDSLEKISNESFNVDTKSLEENLETILKDTEVKELQPKYLNNQLEESKEDIKLAAKNILINPSEYRLEISGLLDNLELRAKNISEAVDKEAVKTAVSKNTELTEEEAEEAVDNIYNEYLIASENVTKSIENAKIEIQEISENVEEVKEDIKIGADQVADTGAKSSVYLFIGLFIALIITSIMGVKGAEFLKD